MREIRVSTLLNNYPVRIGKEILIESIDFIESIRESRRMFAIVDEKFSELHGEVLRAFFKRLKIKNDEVLKFYATERNKSVKSLELIYESLNNKGFGRDTMVLSFGGGITGDVAGFAAATYMRGIPYVNFPTTLLAAVDSSIGGKTGVNFNNVKNLIGAFYQPQAVIVETSFFTTLPAEELLCGLGEVIKYAFLFSEKLLRYLEENIQGVFALQFPIIEYLVEKSVEFKSEIVAKDEKEKGLRKILNLGHTIAHALEIEQEHKIKHGAAVIFGIVAILFISEEIGLINTQTLSNYLLIFENIKSRVKLRKIKYDKFLFLLLKDKKNRRGKIKFVLLKQVAKPIFDVDVNDSVIINSVKKTEEYFNAK